MEIYGVSFDLVGKQPIVLLKTADGNKFLPIWIGHPEAAAILVKLQNAPRPGPMTHDLVTDMLGQLDAEVVSVTVTELRENTFYARITLQQNGSRSRSTRARPTRSPWRCAAGAQIFAADDVIEESGIEFEGEWRRTEELGRRSRRWRTSTRPSSGASSTACRPTSSPARKRTSARASRETSRLVRSSSSE